MNKIERLKMVATVYDDGMKEIMERYNNESERARKVLVRDNSCMVYSSFIFGVCGVCDDLNYWLCGEDIIDNVWNYGISVCWRDAINNVINGEAAIDNLGLLYYDIVDVNDWKLEGNSKVYEEMEEKKIVYEWGKGYIRK